MKIYKSESGKCNVAGQKIRFIREASGLSQEQLAAKIQLAGYNINQKAISRIETGERVLADYELVYFANALCVSVNVLLGLE